MCGYVKTKNDKYIDDDAFGTVSGSNNIFAIAASAECDNYNILDCVVAYLLYLNNSFNNVNAGSKYKYSIDKSRNILTFIVLHED